MTPPSHYSAEDIFWAYRLAKFEIAAPGTGLRFRSFAQYEKDLAHHVRHLSAKQITPSNLFRRVRPGRCWFRPKSLDCHPNATVLQGPQDAFEESVLSIPAPIDGQVSLGLRAILEINPEFAIHEVLWLREFGPALDAVLARNCLANRLEVDGDPPGFRLTGRRVYKHWRPAYELFQKSALDRALDLLQEPRGECILIAVDVASYYDNIDPSFLLQEQFVARVEEAAARRRISFDRAAYVESTHRLLSLFRRYRTEMGNALGVKMERGVPIGSLTAPLVGNLALEPLDRYLQSTKAVRYFTRYVDDLLIVLDPDHISEESHLRAHRTVASVMPIKSSRTSAESMLLDESVLQRSGSRFAVQRKKTKVFHLSGRIGIEYLNAIRDDIRRISSEHRHFLEPIKGDWSEDLVSITPTGERARALRDGDVLRMRQSIAKSVCNKVMVGASMLSRPEARRLSRQYLARMVPLLVEGRHWVQFLDVTLRLIEVASFAGDDVTVREAIDGVLRCMDSVRKLSHKRLRVTCGETKVRGKRVPVELIYSWLSDRIVGSICAAALFDERGFVDESIGRICDSVGLQRRKAIIERASIIRKAALRVVDREADAVHGASIIGMDPRRAHELDRLLENGGEYAARRVQVQKFVDICKGQGDIAYGSLMPIDLMLDKSGPTYYDILLRWIVSDQLRVSLVDLVNAVRGTRYLRDPMRVDYEKQLVDARDPADWRCVEGGITRVILGNLCLPEEWAHAALSSPMLTLQRVLDVGQMINRATEVWRTDRHKPTLLVLPELALPRRWVRYILGHFVRQRIWVGLVTGLEYRVVGNEVYNEAIALLPRDFHAAVAWIWTKGHPAHGERAELEPRYQFNGRGERQPKMVVASEHGRFACLICSELLEPRWRAELLGRIDMVLVPAWNSDTTTFEYMVQAAALDLHGFVAIANNGRYSDCRARGPYGTPYWMREACRLISRGQNNVVVAEFPIGSLNRYRRDPRAYQREKRERAFYGEYLYYRTRNRLRGLTALYGRATLEPLLDWKPAPPGTRWRRR